MFMTGNPMMMNPMMGNPMMNPNPMMMNPNPMMMNPNPMMMNPNPMMMSPMMMGNPGGNPMGFGGMQPQGPAFGQPDASIF